MSSQAQTLLDSFDSLPASEKELVATEILHRLPAEVDLSHAALAALADELFTQLDAEEEAAHAGS